jgi:PEP-CTERM motif
MKIKQALLGFGTLLCALSSVEARTVFWGSPTGSVLYQSDGTTPVDDSFTFLLGSFEVGYDPLSEAVETWSSNWHTFDQAYYNESTQYFSSTANLLEDGTSDGVNADPTFDFRSKRLYLWVYNSATFDPNTPTTNELALFTGDSWVLPAVANCGCGEDNLPLEFYPSNTTSAVIGNVDPDYTGIGSPIVGPLGEYTPPTGAYDFQTHSFIVVPEPSVSLLGALGVLGFVLRRKRSA